MPGIPILRLRLLWAVCIHRTQICTLCGRFFWQVLQTGMSSWLDVSGLAMLFAFQQTSHVHSSCSSSCRLHARGGCDGSGV